MKETDVVKPNVAARAVGAVLGALVIVVFAACTPSDGPVAPDSGSQQSGY